MPRRRVLRAFSLLPFFFPSRHRTIHATDLDSVLGRTISRACRSPPP